MYLDDNCNEVFFLHAFLGRWLKWLAPDVGRNQDFPWARPWGDIIICKQSDQ
jgi:hypothetical protein